MPNNTVKHKFQSAKPEGTDGTLVSANEWNNEHAFAGGADGDLLVRDSTQTDGAAWSSTPPSVPPTLPTGSKVTMGTSSSTAGVEGIANLQLGTVGTGADTTEDQLYAYTLPANALSATGKALRIRAYVRSATSNTHSKTARVYFGSQKVADIAVTDAVNATLFSGFIDVLVRKTGSSTQTVMSAAAIAPQTAASVGVTLTLVGITAGTQTDTAGIIIKVTGQSSAATASDVVCDGITVEFLN